MTKKISLMVCTQARGGMRTVVEAYERDGLFDRWRFQSLWTHREGSALMRIFVGFRAYVHLLWLLLRSRVSFMHVHAAMRGSFWRKSLFAATARQFGVPAILHLHGSEMKTFYQSLSKSRQAAVRRSLENAAAVIVLSESWRRFVEQIAPAAHITIINNYVPVPDKLPAPRPLGEFTVLFLGILGRRKGIYDLLDCWPDVLAAVPGARLRLGGNGEIEIAKAHALALGINASVDFLGWVDGVRKLELLQAADAFVLPSYNEGLPMSVLEAMSWRIPVVTTPVGGIPELISDGLDGLLCEPGDQAGLATALIRLGKDQAFRNRIGAAGQERVREDYSDKAVLPRLEALYAKVQQPRMD